MKINLFFVIISILDIYISSPEEYYLVKDTKRVGKLELSILFDYYWVDAKVSADFKKNVFKRCSATMDAWFSCI